MEIPKNKMIQFIMNTSYNLMYENRLILLKSLYNDPLSIDFLIESQDGVRINLDQVNINTIKKIYFIIKTKFNIDIITTDV
mgnify:CR=1 FL=1